MDTNRKVVLMTIEPRVPENARHDIVTLVEKLIARSQRGFSITSKRTFEDLEHIAADYLHANYPSVRLIYLAELRLRIDSDVYETLLDGPLYAIANSRALEDLAQNVADQAIDPESVDGKNVRRRLKKVAKDDLGAGLKAARGAFLYHLEAKLPHDGKAYDALLAGPLSFLGDL